MKKISQLFDVKYGVNLELNSLKQCRIGEKNSVNFVSRTSRNNGVTAIVELIAGIEPVPAGTISVAGGGSVLETFLQPQPYYSGRDLFFLTPKMDMTEKIMLIYCSYIKANKYKYNYGRQANKTLGDILVPDILEILETINDMPDCYDFGTIKNVLSPKENGPLEIKDWKAFRYDELFDIERGTGPRKQDLEKGPTPFVTSIDTNNGVTAYVNYIPTHRGNTLSVNRNGSVAEAFYQEHPFCSTEDVHIFNPKFELNKYIAMFLISLIRQEKYRYSYGRKWGIDRMNNSIIKLPVTDEGTPDFDYMESYIKSLLYSASI